MTAQDESSNLISSTTDPDYIAESAANALFESAITDTDQTDDTSDIKYLREQRLAHHSLPWLQKPTVSKICFVLLIRFISFAVSLSSTFVLILQVMCREAMKNHGVDTCHDPKVQELASNLQLKLTIITGFTATLVSGKTGQLSDQFGRKKVLVFMAIASILAKLMTLLALKPDISYHESLFFIAAVLDNLGGGVVGVLSVANSYITDIVEPHARVVSLGFSSGTMYAGMGIGPVIGGLIVSSTGNNFYPLFLEIILSVVSLLLIVVFIKESRSSHLRRKSKSMQTKPNKSNSSPLSSSTPSNIQSTESNYSKNLLNRAILTLSELFKPLKLLWLPRDPTSNYKPRFNVLLLVIAECIIITSSASIWSPLVLFVTYQYNWNSVMINYFMSLAGIFRILALYIFSPVFTHVSRKFIPHSTTSLDLIDKITITTGTSFELLSPGLIILSKSSFLIYLSAIFASLGVLAIPTIQSSIIKYMKEEQVGEVFGALALLKNLAITGGLSLFLFIYSHSVEYWPKLVFIVAFCFILLAVLCSLFLIPHAKSQEECVNEEVTGYGSIHVDDDSRNGRNV